MNKRNSRNDCGMGRMIDPLQLKGNEEVAQFIQNIFANSNFNARRLAEACGICSRMLDDDTTVCLTLAGAMTPIGLSGPIIETMELGFIDFIISTGANLYHDLHRPFNYPVRQGTPFVDDGKLYNMGIGASMILSFKMMKRCGRPTESFLKQLKRYSQTDLFPLPIFITSWDSRYKKLHLIRKNRCWCRPPG